MITVLILLALSSARGARLASTHASQAKVRYAGAVAVLYDPRAPTPHDSRAHAIDHCPSEQIPGTFCPRGPAQVVLATGFSPGAVRGLDPASVANATQFAVIPTPCGKNPSEPCPHYVRVAAFAAGTGRCIGRAAACRLIAPAGRSRGALLGTTASVLDLVKHADVRAEWGREGLGAGAAGSSLLQLSAPAHARRTRRRRRRKTSIGRTLRDGEHVDISSLPSPSFELLRFSGTMTPDNAFTSCSIEGDVQRCQPRGAAVRRGAACRNRTVLQTNVPSPSPLLASCSKMSLVDLQKQAAAATQLQRLSTAGMWSLLRGQHFDGAAFNQSVRELRDDVNAGATMAQACPAAGLVRCRSCQLAFSGRIAVHTQVLFSAFERVVLTMRGQTTLAGSLDVQSVAGLYVGDDDEPFQVESEPVELQLLLGDVPVLLVVRGGADLDTTVRLAGSGTLQTTLSVAREVHLKAGYLKGRGAFVAPVRVPAIAWPNGVGRQMGESFTRRVGGGAPAPARTGCPVRRPPVLTTPPALRTRSTPCSRSLAARASPSGTRTWLVSSRWRSRTCSPTGWRRM